MKKILIKTISFYQVFVSSSIHQLVGTNNACRFSPTCSEYAKEAILKEGIFKGVQLAVLRILKCQPFYKLSI